MATKEANWDTPLNTDGEAFELLRNARKAWIYTYIHHPSTTIQDIIKTLDLPDLTVYEYIDDLETAVSIDQSNDGRPAEYTAHDIDLQLSTQRVIQLLTKHTMRDG